MKNLLIIVLFCFSASAAAQYGYGYPGGGVDHRITGKNTGSNKPRKNEEKPDMVELSMKKLNDELTLDSFQFAAIKQMMDDNQEKESRIISDTTPTEIKLEQIVLLREKLHTKIKEVLTPEQITKFEAMTDKKKKK